jgi:hypothetical protein
MRGTLVVLAAALVAAVAPASVVAAKPSCGVAVLRDWSDGKLNRSYPVRCYQDAINRMPEDMRSYTTAPDDIQRALLARLRAGRAHHVAPTRRPAAMHTAAPRRATAPTRTQARRGWEREALSASGLDGGAGATGMPLPLFALAGIGVVLLAAGLAGLASRRLRNRA